MVIETCNSYYYGCVGSCDDLELNISNVDTDPYTVWFVSNTGKFRQTISNDNGTITVDCSTLNESKEYYISIHDSDNNTVPITIDSILYDAIVVKTEII